MCKEDDEYPTRQVEMKLSKETGAPQAGKCTELALSFPNAPRRLNHGHVSWLPSESE